MNTVLKHQDYVALIVKIYKSDQSSHIVKEQKNKAHI